MTNGAARTRALLLAIVPLALLALLGWRIGVAMEARVEARLQRAGLSARAVRFSWIGPLRLEGVSGETHGVRLSIDEARLRWRILGGRDPLSHLSRVGVRGLRIEQAPLAFVWPEGEVGVGKGDGALEVSEGALAVSQVDLGTARIEWRGAPVGSPGRWSGRATIARPAGGFLSTGSFRAEGVRLAAPEPGAQNADPGAPTTLRLEWKLEADERRLEIGHLAAQIAGLDVSARAVVQRTPDRAVVASVKAEGELGEVFRATGLEAPLPRLPGSRLGRVSLDLAVRGPLADPGSLSVDSRLTVKPEPEVARALAYLRGPFVHKPDDSPGFAVAVREDAPEFIPIGAVPALFQRALLISEDAGFMGHAGVDPAEIVAAWAENESEEEPRRVRGASTITQQLVKNLYLSNEKTYGRKLQEAALAILVDAVVPKARLLEIYVNVIEWGPRLHGIGPAARHYFAKSPAELTPKEACFLICLIPSPVRYHQAHLDGKLGPGMEQLVRNLLAKLRSVGELDDLAYEKAVQEELQFAPE